MKKHIGIMILAVACMVAVFGTASVRAAGTGTYLAGYWSAGEDEYTAYFITNPTVKPVDIYAVTLTITGTFHACYAQEVGPNETWYVRPPYEDGGDATGVIKFFAFPRGSLRFDPNAVIGGFQRRVDCDKYKGTYFPNVTDENLSEIPINSATLAEFGRYPLTTCDSVLPPYIAPPLFCHNLNEES